VTYLIKYNVSVATVVILVFSSTWIYIVVDLANFLFIPNRN